MKTVDDYIKEVAQGWDTVESLREKVALLEQENKGIRERFVQAAEVIQNYADKIQDLKAQVYQLEGQAEIDRQTLGYRQAALTEARAELNALKEQNDQT